MDIIIDGTRLKKQCNKATGKLKRRLDDIRAADNLSILKRIFPGNCHPLKHNKKGLWALHIEEPYRLVFQPANDPLPLSQDGWLDLEQITIVRIISIEDYHASKKH